jgi:hypothetical protein
MERSMKDVQPIEYSNQRILTTQQLAEAYGTDTNNIIVNFSRNKEHYIIGKHYYSLEGEELKLFKSYLTNCNVAVDKFSSSLYLWTEKGALMHAKSLNTDQAWEVYEQLVDEYYRLQRVSSVQEKMKRSSGRPRKTVEPKPVVERLGDPPHFLAEPAELVAEEILGYFDGGMADLLFEYLYYMNVPMTFRQIRTECAAFGCVPSHVVRASLQDCVDFGNLEKSAGGYYCVPEFLKAHDCALVVYISPLQGNS